MAPERHTDSWGTMHASTSIGFGGTTRVPGEPINTYGIGEWFVIVK